MLSNFERGIGEPGAENLLGVALQQSGCLSDAAMAYRRSVRSGLADLINCWNNLAGVCYLLGEYGEAAEVAGNLRSYQPFDADLLGLHVLSLIELGKKAEAEQVAREFLRNAPRSIHGARWFIHCACKNRKYLEAILAAAEIPPHLWDMGGLANELLQALANLGVGEVARELFPIAYNEDADLYSRLETWATAGSVAFSTGNFAVAKEIYEKGMERGFNDASATMNLSLIELREGQFELGWEHYMVRADAQGFGRQMLADSIPRWEGQPIAGKTLIVTSEQGIGDMIQFLRFIPEMERLGAKVVFSSYADVVGLLRNDPQAASTEVQPLSVEQIDFYTLLLDLPYRLGIKKPADVPCSIPYLYAAPGKSASWKEKFAIYEGMKVGICWAGNPNFQGDHYRSASINIFSALSGMPGVTFIALQKGAGTKEAQCPPEGLPYEWIGDRFANLDDTAAAIENLDLVISTDTSIVHLAAALGKPVWLLLSRRSPDFRWVEVDGRNIWYPNVRVFCQQVDDDWVGLLRRSVRPALAALIGSNVNGIAVWAEKSLAVDAGLMTWQGVDWNAWARDLCDKGDVDIATAWLASYIDSHDCRLALGAIEHAFAARQLVTPNCVSVVTGRVLLKGLDGGAGVATLSQLAAVAGDVAVGRMGLLEWGWHLLMQGARDEAIALWKRAAVAFPRDGQFFYQIGNALKSAGQKKDALQNFKRTLDCFPRHFRALAAIGEIEREGDIPEASASAQKAVLLKHQDVVGWYSVIHLLHDRGMYDLAERILRYKGDIENNTHSKLLRVRQLAMLGRSGEAEELLSAIDQQTVVDPETAQVFASALSYCGKTLVQTEVLQRLVAKDPGARELHFSLGFNLLRAGRCREGWQWYWRGLGRANAGHYEEWEGQCLEGKALLVVQDQGQGDAIQFFPLLRELHAQMPKRLTVAVSRPLVTLFRSQDVPFEVIDLQQLDWDDYRYDFQVDFMALPYLLEVDLCAPRCSQPTLVVTPGLVGKWQDVLARDENMKIGIVWSGGDLFKANYVRSTALESWRALWAIEGVSYYSLQKDIHSNQAAVFDRPLHNVAADCPTWLETLSVIDSLDLVITTCTAVAHAAGSINKPTWVILSNEHVDFRWLEARDDSPWYPSVRLIRRQLGESWNQLFERVAEDLVARFKQLSWRDEKVTC